MAARELAVLIVSYRRADLLDRALAGVEKYLPDAPVHVWDNRSAASPEVAALAGRPPDVTWTFSELNVGYVAAMNRLAEQVPGCDMLHLDPDAELLGPLTAARAALAEPGVAAVSPTVEDGREGDDPRREERWDVAHREQTVVRNLVNTAGYSGRWRGRTVSDLYPEPPGEVDGYLTGCCLLVSRDAWEALGPFGGRFFVYGEDATWQPAARAAGWSLRLVDDPDPPVRHASAGTVADDPLTSRRGSDLLRSAQVMVLGYAHNRGAGTVFSLGTIVLDRVQRSKRVARRRCRAASREHSGGRPAVVVTTNGLANGGPDRQRVLLANALVRRHHPVTLVCLQKLGRYTAELDPRVRLVLQPWWQPVIDVAQDDAVVVGGITNTGIGFARGWRALGRLTGRRRRWLPATHDPAVAEGPTYTASQARALRSADGLLVLSPRHHADLTRHQRLTDVVMVAPNGIPAADARPFRGGTGPIRLGMLTRVVEYKNPLLLADALDALGPDHAFAEIDVLCVPSGFEAFPLVMVEAMTRGIPVLASASGAVAEMLDDGRAGVVVEPVTREAWTAALERIVDDPVALGRLGAAGRVRALERYTDAAMADDYQRAIAHVLGRPIPGGPDAPAVLL